MSGILDKINSDHKHIFTMFRLMLPDHKIPQLKQIQRYSNSNTNLDSVIQELESKLNIFYNDKSPDFKTFFNIFKSAIDTHCKLQNPKISERNPINNPWITGGII